MQRIKIFAQREKVIADKQYLHQEGDKNKKVNKYLSFKTDVAKKCWKI